MTWEEFVNKYVAITIDGEDYTIIFYAFIILSLLFAFLILRNWW